MSAGWTGSDLAAGDVAWHAWHRLGVSPMEFVIGGSIPPALEGLAAAIEPEMDRLAREVLDEASMRLYGEARERVVRSAQQDLVRQAIWSVVGAVRRELMRPEPVPFNPPAIGAWIRGRWLPRPAIGRLGPRPDPTWDGKWHLFSGDLVTWPHRVNDVDGRSGCGRRVTLRSARAEAAIANEMPGIDACRQCRKIAASARLTA